MKLYKFSKDIGRWKIGKWRTIEELNGSNSGFYASEQPLSALLHAPGEIIAIVEGAGERNIDTNKTAFQKMRIVEAYRWTQRDGVALSIYCAGLVLHNFESVYPKVHRPRLAIAATKTWLKNPTEMNRVAASAAGSAAALIAELAEGSSPAKLAAKLAAKSAALAASAARATAGSATGAVVWSARLAAESTVWSAAGLATTKKINAWMKRRINKLEEMTK